MHEGKRPRSVSIHPSRPRLKEQRPCHARSGSHLSIRKAILIYSANADSARCKIDLHTFCRIRAVQGPIRRVVFSARRTARYMSSTRSTQRYSAVHSDITLASPSGLPRRYHDALLNALQPSAVTMLWIIRRYCMKAHPYIPRSTLPQAQSRLSVMVLRSNRKQRSHPLSNLHLVETLRALGAVAVMDLWRMNIGSSNR